MSEPDAAAEAVSGAASPGGASPRPGRALAEARVARNLTVAEVAQQLKLSPSQVEALEADSYARLPGPVFVRGFVRNYARLLDLDAEAMADLVDLPHAPAPASAAVPLSRNIPFPEGRQTRWLPYLLALAVIFGIVVVFEFFFSEPPAVVVSAVPPAPAVVPEAVPQKAAAPELVPVAQSQSPSPAQEPPQALSQNESPPAAAAEPVPVKAETQKAAGLAELHFVFETESWVEVRDRNDRILFSQLNPVGAEQHLQARPPLSLVVGNARGVRLTYNGQVINLAPHTRVEVARLNLPLVNP